MIFLTIWFIGNEILLSKTFANAKELLSTVFDTMIDCKMLVIKTRSCPDVLSEIVG